MTKYNHCRSLNKIWVKERRLFGQKCHLPEFFFGDHESLFSPIGLISFIHYLQQKIAKVAKVLKLTLFSDLLKA